LTPYFSAISGLTGECFRNSYLEVNNLSFIHVQTSLIGTVYNLYMTGMVFKF
jgi:hypothetical protein